MSYLRRIPQIGLACVIALASRPIAREVFAEPPSAEVAQPPSTSAVDRAVERNSPVPSSGPETTVPDNSLQFRRVYVPEERIGDWSSDQQRYLPMKADEFDRLLRHSEALAGHQSPPSPVQLKAAHYTATLSDDALVAGQATLTIEAVEKRSEFLALDPCRLAIESPRWVANEPKSTAKTDPQGEPGPIALGARGDGKLAIQVAESGRLQFEWTLRGQHEPGDAIVFPLLLPRCPCTDLKLSLPAAVVPIVDQAIVSPLPDTTRNSGRTKTASVSASRQESRTRVWHIELGGQNLATLKIVNADTVREPRPLTLVREAATYEFSPRGLQLSTELRLDILHEAIRQIPLDIDWPLTLVTARIGDAQIPWYEVGADEKAPLKSLLDQTTAIESKLPLPLAPLASPRRIVLELPEPLRGSGRVVRLGAIAPLPSRGRLPTIRPAPPSLLWQEGTTTLLIQSPLQLNEFRPNGCQQAKRESLPPDGQTEAVTLQNFRPDPDVQVAVGRHPDQFTVDSGTTIDAGGASIRGVAIVDVTAQAGECFSLTAGVPASWIIDSIDSNPAGGVADWNITRSATAPSRLKLNFSKAVRTDRPLRLVITGRWRRPPTGETLRAPDLQLLSFDDVRVGRRVVAIRVAAPLHLQLSGGEKLTRLASDHLDAVDAARLGNSSRATAIFVIDDEATNAAVTFSKELPNYAGDVRLNVAVADETTTESYTLTCTPKSSEVERLLVQFFPGRSSQLEWTMLPEEDSADRTPSETITARKLSQTTQSKYGISSGEVWELSWPHPRTKAFQIRATRTTPLASSLPVALVQLPGAAAQTGAVEIRSSAARPREIQNRRLKQIDTPAVPQDRWPDVIAAYEYNPAEEAALWAVNPLPNLTIGRGKSLPAAWIWSMQIDALWLRQGYCENRAIWRIENTRRTRITIQLPSLAVLGAVWIDGAPVLNPAINSAGTLQLDLPNGRRFPVVVVRWSCQESPLSIIGARSFESPEIADMRVLSRKMRLWLPANWRVASDSTGPFGAQAVSWSQRLFGPFGQPQGEAPFDPFAVKDWRELAGLIGVGDAAWSEAARIVEQLNAAARPTQSSTPQALKTWGQLIGAVETMPNGHIDPAAPILLIDRQALAEAGVFPDTRVLFSVDIPKQAGNVLDDADMTILVAPEALLLTTHSAAANWLKTSSVTHDGPLMRVPAGAMREQLRSAALGTNPTFVPKDFWCLSLPPAPWLPDRERADDSDRSGWIVYELESPDVPERLWFVRHDVLVAAGCAIFMTGLVVAAWKRDCGWRWKCGSLALAAALAMVIPGWLSPLSSGLFLGLLCGWLIPWSKLASPHDGQRATSLRDRYPTAPVASMALFVAAWFVAPRCGRPADSTPERPIEPKHPIYDVLVPVDHQDHPVGDHLLLPQPLYDAISARIARHDGKADEALLMSATYRGSLVQDASGKPVISRDWSAHFEFETFAAGTKLQFRFGGGDVHLIPDGVRIDGRPSEFEWKDSGRSLAFMVRDAGRHELDLGFRPTPQMANSVATIELAIPRMPNARLELEAPSDVSVEVPSAEGLVSRAIQGHIVAAIGATDRLTIRIGTPAAAESKPSLAGVEELLWLKVRPGSVVLDARLIIHVAKGSLRQVQLLADPRLRRLPLEAGSPIAQVHTQTADVNTISLALARPITDDVAMKLSFFVTETSGIGNLRLPRLDVAGARTVNRRLAVSIESPLTADDQSLSRLKTSSVADFLSAWGPTDVKPLYTFSLTEAAEGWSLAVHPRQPQLTSSTLSVVSLGAERVSAAWLTDLKVEGGSVYQLQLELPRDFAMESAAIREADDADQPLRWSQGASGNVTLFLPNPPTDHYALLVHGSAPPSIDTPARIPALQIVGSTLESQAIVMFRQADASVTIVDRAGLSLQTGKEAQHAIDRASAAGMIDRADLSDSERLVAVLEGTAGAEAPRIRIARNAPRVEGSQRTTVKRNGGGWTATVDLDLTISEGVLDGLRLEFPPQFSSVAQVSPAIPSKIVDVPGEVNRQLVLRPAEPLVGVQRIRFEGPIALGAGERLKVPDIRPLGLGSVRRIVLLPTSSNEQEYFWETRGLNFEPLPASFSATSPHTEIQRTCQVVGEHFEATLKSIEKSIHGPRIRLADIRLAMSDEANGCGIATFDLEPAGNKSSVLELPVDERLLHARVNDGPAVLTLIAPNQWRVAGGSARLPQRIEIMFAIDRSSTVADPPTTYRGPTLVGVAVDQTLWSLTTPGDASAASAGPELPAISSLDAELIRLQACSAMLESAADQLSNETSQQSARVYSDWLRRLSAQHAAIDRERVRIRPATSDATVDAALRTADAIRSRLERAVGSQPNARPADQASLPADVAIVWSSVEDQERLPSIFSTAGPAPILSIRPLRSTAYSLWLRVLLGLASSAVVAAAFWLARRSEVQGVLAHWPWVPGVLAGLAWWLWLAPSVAGWVIAGASILYAYRDRWHGSPVRPSDSKRALNQGSSIIGASAPTPRFSGPSD
jgi:hypothetical protein